MLCAIAHIITRAVQQLISDHSTHTKIICMLV